MPNNAVKHTPISTFIRRDNPEHTQMEESRHRLFFNNFLRYSTPLPIKKIARNEDISMLLPPTSLFPPTMSQTPAARDISMILKPKKQIREASPTHDGSNNNRKPTESPKWLWRAPFRTKRHKHNVTNVKSTLDDVVETKESQKIRLWATTPSSSSSSSNVTGTAAVVHQRTTKKGFCSQTLDPNEVEKTRTGKDHSKKKECCSKALVIQKDNYCTQCTVGQQQLLQQQQQNQLYRGDNDGGGGGGGGGGSRVAWFGATIAIHDIFGIGKVTEMILGLFLAHDAFLSRRPYTLQCVILAWEGIMGLGLLWIVMRIVGLAEVVVWGVDDVTRSVFGAIRGICRSVGLLMNITIT